MLRPTLALVVCVSYVNQTRTVHAVEPLDVLNKAIEAHGGKEKLAKHTARKLKCQGTLAGPDGGQFQFSSTYYFDTPNRFRADYQLTVGEATVPIIQIVDGDKGWMKIGDEVAALTKAQMESFKANLRADAALRLVPLLDKTVNLSLVGEIEDDGNKLTGITATGKDGLDVSIYVDSKTHLIVKQEYPAKDFFTGKQALYELRASKHKATNGVMLPTRLVYSADEKTLTSADVESTEFVDKFDASLFAKP